MLDRDGVRRWLDAYLDAWRSNDAATIEALFTEDATYAYSPWKEPVRGAAAIAADWLSEPDDPADWTAAYEPLLVEGDRAVATGETTYRAADRTYANLFVMRFDPQGRCAEFVEWFVRRPAGTD